MRQELKEHITAQAAAVEVLSAIFDTLAYLDGESLKLKDTIEAVSKSQEGVSQAMEEGDKKFLKMFQFNRYGQ